MKLFQLSWVLTKNLIHNTILIYSRIYRSYRNENFCEGTWVSKVIAGNKTKKVCWFSHMSVMASLLCFGCFAAGRHVYRCFLFTHCNIYNWLDNACTLKLQLNCQVYAKLRKQCDFFEFLRVQSGCFVWMRRDRWSFNVAPKTTSIEDAY